MNLTFQQKLTISIGIVGAATSAFGALNPIMTSTEALIGTVAFGFLSACLGVVATVVSSQGAQIDSVLAMPGVEKISVNAQANKTLASKAIDQTVDKIAPTQAALIDVTKTAQGI